MKKILFILLSLFSTSLLADPTVFGLTIGKTTISQLKNTYSVNYSGQNKYSLGDMYEIPRGQINFDGIGAVTAIFDSSNTLVAVLSEFPKSKFDYLNSAIAKKYTLMNKKIPFVGDKSATYQSGNTEITLSAPHMSFQMSMNYIHTDLLKAYNKQSKAEEKQKQEQESSML
ncbi:hypothetical protein C9J03_11740 [Photobacterium gaetbulicola]|uniref:hypothetical protein n=1 Tax=Photobacterium gaetbulicola TaxID=1295392 RepID=UPI0005CBD23B|nr:hypothetical protein [Photobacterium gaetbulicola]PSU11802.1 hypothetical protein C9J03_11740 [Photobacterium gaetbulicola]